MKKHSDASICVFLALVLLLIIALVLGMVESALRSSSGSYAQMLLKTASESVMGEYNGPLFADYHILALDSGFGNTAGDLDELERKLAYYMGDNVWNFRNENVRVTDVSKLMDKMGTNFIEQSIAYEKYATVEDVLNEVLERVKNLGNQGNLTKIMERKMNIEDELSIIDTSTLELMRIIDGVKMTMGKKTSSLVGYTIENSFIKKFFVGGCDMSSSGINNPSVYEKVKDKYIDPIKKIDEYIELLKENQKTLTEIQDDQKKYDEAVRKIEENTKIIEEMVKEAEQLDKDIKTLEDTVKECEEKIEEADDIEDEKEAQSIRNRYSAMKSDSEKKIGMMQTRKSELEKSMESIKTIIAAAESVKKELDKKISEAKKLLSDQVKRCNTGADELSALIGDTRKMLDSVKDIVKKVGEKQSQIRPMVEEYDEILKKFSPVLDKDTKEGFEESLEYMKAYVGMGNSKMKVTDFDAINKTAEYDITVLECVDMNAFSRITKDVLEEINMRIQKAEQAKVTITNFSYNGFSFDYSEIKESAIENKLIAEFESNISDGYLKLFLKPDTILSENSVFSVLLPSKWYEVGKNDEDNLNGITDNADTKSSSSYLKNTEDGSGISELISLLGSGMEKIGKKLLMAMYMEHHFKSFRDKSVTGDTVLDYEIEYILSGYENDKANLSAAVTKIMLMRFAVSAMYTLTNKKTKAQAQALAISILGFTGFPFLISLVKYLILFLWAAAQAVIETAAIVRGKKVPILTSDESFCLSLTELPVFASLVSEKADNFKESPVYLDYDNYLLILLLIQGEKKQAARAMDVIQENIRYKYDEDFLMINAITGFSCTAEFSVPSKYASFLSGFGKIGSFYTVKVKDAVAY